MSDQPSESRSEEPQSSPSSSDTRPPFPVVGIGASAGGLDALKQLFSTVPADSGLAYVVVMHLSPEHESHLPELLQPHVSIPVRQVADTVALEKNSVYVIPPNANLDTIDTHLRLSALEAERKKRAPIDHFFRTLAKTHDGAAIGVVLTGTGSDGTLGLREIKERGGLVIVQDPADAEFDGMPQSAVSAGVADLILPLNQIASSILQFVEVRPQVPLSGQEQALGQEEERLLRAIFGQIRARTQRDFSNYKRSTVLRRIARRMQFHRIELLSQYVELLRGNAEETRKLADELLITVTSFFRDPDFFETLEKEVIPELFDRHHSDDPIRVWTVGCATGEEAYSIAILLLEESRRRGSTLPLQIFASDLHEHSLSRAREGFYPGDVATDVNPQRLKRYFIKKDGGYRVTEELRELVVFASHNVLGDPPFSHIDLISCRNLLIYLQREAQSEVVAVFHYALRPDGLLALGTSESVESGDLFDVVSKNACIFRRRNVQGPELKLPVFPVNRRHHVDAAATIEDAEPSTVTSGMLHQELIEEFAPPSLLVNAHDKAVHFSAKAGKYMVQPAGEPTTDVLQLIRKELRVELHAAITVARTQGVAVRSHPVAARFNGDAAEVKIHVRPSRKRSHEGYLLITLTENGERADSDLQETRLQPADQEGSQELALTRERLHSILKKYESGKEDLRASNEELQSSNEELRSTLEELETSKEELQSMNEELQTVNQENRHKVEELSQLSSDLQNLLAATEIATLFLDRQLRILRFTPKAATIFNMRFTDSGRPLTDLTHRLGYDGLHDDAKQVLDRLIPVEREVQDEDDRWYLSRILPYRSAEDRIEGVVITFVEITARRRAEEALRQNEERYRLLVENAREYAIVMLDAEGRITTWSAGAERIFGYRESEAIGRPMAMLFTDEDRATGAHLAELEQAARTGRAGDERWQRRKDGSTFWAGGVVEALYGESRGGVGGKANQAVAYVKVLRDNTERKQLEDNLRSTAAELANANRIKDELLATMAHELRNPLAPIRSGLELLSSKHEDPQTVRDICEMMSRQVKQLVAIVDDLLDISRVTRGTLRLRMQTVAVSDLMRCSAEATQPLIDAAKHAFDVDLPEQPLFVEADPKRMVQVFSNLLNNAAKYTPDGGHVGFSAAPDGDHVIISVRDTGSGIPPEELENVFDMFTQLDQPMEQGDGGLGIGLTLAKSLVEMHGGTISVASEGEGNGCTFSVRLPCRSEDSPRPTTDASTGGNQPTGQRRVLIVDDNRAAVHMLATLMRVDGHIVRTASDGEEACEVAESFRPDLVLMDIGMPRMNGYEAAKHMRSQPWGRTMTLVAVTGWGNEKDKSKTKEAGFDHHLVKPIEVSSVKPFLQG